MNEIQKRLNIVKVINDLIIEYYEQYGVNPLIMYINQSLLNQLLKESNTIRPFLEIFKYKGMEVRVSDNESILLRSDYI